MNKPDRGHPNVEAVIKLLKPYTTEHIAERLHIKQSTARRWKRGKIGGYHYVQNIAHVFAVPFSILWNEVGNDKAA